LNGLTFDLLVPDELYFKLGTGGESDCLLINKIKGSYAKGVYPVTGPIAN